MKGPLAILFFSIIALMVACGEKQADTQEKGQHGDKDTMLDQQPAPQGNDLQKPLWTSVNQLNGLWVKVEPTDSGYVVQQPCSGKIARLQFDSATKQLTWRPRLDIPQTFGLLKATLSQQRDALAVIVQAPEDETVYTLSATFVKNNIIECKVRDIQSNALRSLFFTKVSHSKGLPQIHSPCLPDSLTNDILF